MVDIYENFGVARGLVMTVKCINMNNDMYKLNEEWWGNI